MAADDIFWYFSYFSFLENRNWHFMQIVSLGDNLHEVSDPILRDTCHEVPDPFL